jgi:hypothetical protein
MSAIIVARAMQRTTTERALRRELSHHPASVAAAGLFLLALASVPVFSTSLPPLFDYPNHLARFWLLSVGGNSFYGVRWAPLPNLAGDALVPLLAQIIPLQLAGKLFLIAILALILGGAAWLNRALTGGWRLWPLIAALFLYNRTFLWGFINYLFSLGIALCGAALWLRLEDARSWVRVLLSSLTALLCFFSHIAAFGVYALVIVGFEAPLAISEARGPAWRAFARRIALVVPQFAIPLALGLGSWRSTPSDVHYGAFSRKADLLFSVFDNYNRTFDIACFTVLLVLLAALTWSGRMRILSRSGLPLAFVLAAYLLLPSQILSGSGADHRIAVAVFVFMAASTAPQFANRREAIALGVVLLSVFVIRIGVIESVWVAADRIYQADIAAIDQLPVGSTVAVAFPSDAVNATPIPMLHLPTLAVARRAAFVPTLFTDPAQQPVFVKAPYDRLAAASSPELWWSAFVVGNVAAQRRLSPMLDDWTAIAFVDRQSFHVQAFPCLESLISQTTFQLFIVKHDHHCSLD